jgi:hypothetical protein
MNEKEKRKLIDDKIEEFATRIDCPWHFKQMRACAYHEGAPCVCRVLVEEAEGMKE